MSQGWCQQDFLFPEDNYFILFISFTFATHEWSQESEFMKLRVKYFLSLNLFQIDEMCVFTFNERSQRKEFPLWNCLHYHENLRFLLCCFLLEFRWRIPKLFHQINQLHPFSLDSEMLNNIPVSPYDTKFWAMKLASTSGLMMRLLKLNFLSNSRKNVLKT